MMDITRATATARTVIPTITASGGTIDAYGNPQGATTRSSLLVVGFFFRERDLFGGL